MNLLDIIFENEEIRIINKPYNLACQGGQNIKNSLDTVLADQTGEKIYLVHRLDKETSGLLITAKNPKAAAKWTKMIGSKEVKKVYHAICFGKMKEKQGKISEDINDRGVMKQALTRYKVLKEYHVNSIDEDFSLIELDLETGRMHQIRKHLAGKNCPIVNDDKYGDFARNKKLQKSGGIKKMMLFSKKLFFAPKVKINNIEAEYPEHFTKAIDFFSES
ncbi:MAG: RNA pseudouridine synthase [Treponemataceae bacterium]|nr:RNA pseudouridine synthase [Treponemataceae bacterium]